MTNQSLSELIKQAQGQIGAIVSDTVALAKGELKTQMGRALKGIVALLLVAMLAVFFLIMLLHGAAWGLAQTGLPIWASYLIVSGALLIIMLILTLFGIRSFKKITPPVQTIASLKGTAEAFKPAPSTQRTIDDLIDPDSAPEPMAPIAQATALMEQYHDQQSR